MEFSLRIRAGQVLLAQGQFYCSDLIKMMQIAAASAIVILTFGTGGLSASSRHALIDEALQFLDLQACATLLA